MDIFDLAAVKLDEEQSRTAQLQSAAFESALEKERQERQAIKLVIDTANKLGSAAVQKLRNAGIKEDYIEEKGFFGRIRKVPLLCNGTPGWLLYDTGIDNGETSYESRGIARARIFLSVSGEIYWGGGPWFSLININVMPANREDDYRWSKAFDGWEMGRSRIGRAGRGVTPEGDLVLSPGQTNPGVPLRNITGLSFSKLVAQKLKGDVGAVELSDFRPGQSTSRGYELGG